MITEFNCPLCGLFDMSDALYKKIANRPLDNALVSCAADNIAYAPKTMSNEKWPYWYLKAEGVDPNTPMLAGFVLRCFDDFEDRTIQHADKPMELLRLLGDKVRSDSPFSRVRFDVRDAFRLKMHGFEEAISWLQVILDEGLIKFTPNVDWSSDVPMSVEDRYCTCEILPKGWSKLAELSAPRLSGQGFIAMDFNLPDRTEIQSAIEKATMNAGYDAKCVDHRELVHNKGISDKIVALIRRSRFLVADLTGANNGAYWEAGLATGIGIEVIYTVSKEWADKHPPHFDVGHISQIRWKTYADLASQLEWRLKKTLPIQTTEKIS